MRTYIRGQNDYELFGIVGPHITTQEIVTFMGAAIVTAPGDVWVVENTRKQVIFCCARPQKNRLLHIRYVWSSSGDTADFTRVIDSIELYARDHNNRGTWTNDAPDRQLWSDRGYTFAPRKRGNFGRWSKDI